MNILKALGMLAVIATASGLGGCSTTMPDIMSDGHPKTLETQPGSWMPKWQLPPITKGYKISVFAGVGEKFKPNPQPTAREMAMLTQIDWQADEELKSVSRNVWEEIRTTGTSGTLIGLFTSLGAKVAFPGVSWLDYLKYAGISGLGSGALTAEVQFRMTMYAAKAYYVMIAVNKADELQKELRRIIIIPLPAAVAKTPTVDPDPNAKDPFAKPDPGDRTPRPAPTAVIPAS